MKLGRKRIGKAKSYRISEEDYLAFSKFCEERNLTKSEALRSLIKHYFVEGMIREVSLETLKELKEKEISK